MTTRSPKGRFIVCLPFSEDPSKLGDSKDIAMRRFFALERRLLRDTELRKQYVHFMNEYIKLGHMEEIHETNISTPHYFIPHHCVVKPDSSTTKLRVVFDASAKTSSNISLNDILHAGPVVQDELFTILMRFRLPRFVFTADIQKMYRQILLREEDRKYHLIHWRKDPNEKLKQYRLNTVTYGTTSAPYLATKCLQRLAAEKETSYPVGAKVLKNDFYVDDVITGSDSLAELQQAQQELIKLLKEAGFSLRKWCSNHPKILQHITPEDQEVQLDFNDTTEDQIKTLGLTWLPKSDVFCIRAIEPTASRITKRSVASDIAKLFDPMGIVAPVVVMAKMFLQELWQLKLDWDAALPQELHTRWINFRQELPHLSKIRVPRHIHDHKNHKNIQIHAFADASERAYGACIYIRTITRENEIIVRLLCAKTRVAPLKKATIPRLELCAAKLSAELSNRVKRDLNLNNTVVHLWTDSEVVLAWINSTHKFPTFVANRVASIQKVTVPAQWRHVSSRNNPADILSRGLTPQGLTSCNLWFYGPIFLHGKQELWPQPYKKEETSRMEEITEDLPLSANATAEIQEKPPVASPKASTFSEMYRKNHRNSFRTLQRVIAYVLRFVHRCRNNSKTPHEGRTLTTIELDEALHLIMRTIQKEEFSIDIHHLQQHRQINKNSPLLSLSPFLDDNCILRVGGRLDAATLPFDARHPMLLPSSHQITTMLLSELHKNNLHVGAQGLLAIARQRFWPVKGKSVARTIVQHCVTCAKAKPKLLNQLMGSLPATRVQPARPFINAGVDFCGPLQIHYRLRGKRPQKAYIAVFCCFSTKAVHLEIVSDLSTIAFIAALKRFMSRRGHCQNLYCDNATNFVGARNQLQELRETIYSEKTREIISRTCNERGINFHFIPPRAPHFGGLWEAAVKSAKHLLVRSLGSASLTYEELETVVIDIEAVLNSRPITPLSSDPNDPAALTPGHFLIGEPLTASVDPTAKPLKADLSTRWKLITHIRQEFWRRWSQEYLNELQQRYKWKERCQNVEPGTIVIIKEDNTPVMKWPLGRITNIYKGDDDCVRVAEVRTATGVFKRPIHKLAPLPVDTQEPETTLNSPTDGPDIVKKGRGMVDKDQPPHENEPLPKRPRTSAGSSIATLFLACLLLPVIRSEPVEVTHFNGHTGLRYDKIGETNLLSNQWTIIVYYDLQPIWSEYQILTKGLESLRHLCSQMIPKNGCLATVEQFEYIQANLEKNNELLIHTTSNKRQKRGAFNIIGNAANALFGILDADYAERMSVTIEQIKGNENHLIALLKNQTSIIDSTINIVKEDQVITENKIKALERHFNNLVNRIRQDGTDDYNQKIQQLFTTLSTQLVLLTTNLQRMHTAILDAITDVHHGRISPSLLSADQLKQELATIKNNLSPPFRPPVSDDDLAHLYQIISIQGRIMDKHVIFRLKMPLINSDPFELLKITPIPLLRNNSFVAIKIKDDYLAISKLRDLYYPISKAELSECKKINNLYLCLLQHPIYHRGANISNCEVQLLNDMNSISNCQLEKIDTYPIWTRILNTNEWIFAVKERTLTNVVCNKQTSTITLNGTGVLKLKPTCIIKQEFATIEGIHNFVNKTFPSHIKLDAALKEIPVDDSIYKAQEAHLNQLHRQLTQTKLEISDHLELHDMRHLIAGHTSLVISIITVIVITGYVILRYYRRKNKMTPTPKPRQSKQETYDFNVNIS